MFRARPETAGAWLQLNKGETVPARLRETRFVITPPKRLSAGHRDGYTEGMKTAVSIPDDLFKGAERLARKTKRSRSRLFSDALKEYLARHTSDSVTEAMNRACAELGEGQDEFVSSASRLVLKREFVLTLPPLRE